jgi:hypothetical protein
MHPMEEENYKEAYGLLRAQLVQMHQGLEKGQKKYKTWQKQIDEALTNADHIATKRLYVLRAIGFQPQFGQKGGGFGYFHDPNLQVYTENEATEERGHGAEWVTIQEARKQVEDYDRYCLNNMPRGPGARS